MKPFVELFLCAASEQLFVLPVGYLLVTWRQLLLQNNCSLFLLASWGEAAYSMQTYEQLFVFPAGCLLRPLLPNNYSDLPKKIWRESFLIPNNLFNIYQYRYRKDRIPNTEVRKHRIPNTEDTETEVRSSYNPIFSEQFQVVRPTLASLRYILWLFSYRLLSVVCLFPLV